MIALSVSSVNCSRELPHLRGFLEIPKFIANWSEMEEALRLMSEIRAEPLNLWRLTVILEMGESCCSTPTWSGDGALYVLAIQHQQ